MGVGPEVQLRPPGNPVEVLQIQARGVSSTRWLGSAVETG